MKLCLEAELNKFEFYMLFSELYSLDQKALSVLISDTHEVSTFTISKQLNAFLELIECVDLIFFNLMDEESFLEEDIPELRKAAFQNLKKIYSQMQSYK